MGHKEDILKTHQKMAEEKMRDRKKIIKGKIFEDLRETVNGFKHLLPDNNKEAWKSLLYYLKRFRKVMKSLQEDINNPDTPDDVRKFLLGKRAGLEQMINFPRMVISYKRTLENDEETNNLTEFLASQHMKNIQNQRRGG